MIKTSLTFLLLFLINIVFAQNETSDIVSFKVKVKTDILFKQSSVLVYDSSYQFLLKKSTKQSFSSDSLESVIISLYSNPERGQAFFENEEQFQQEKKSFKEMVSFKKDLTTSIKFGAKLQFLHYGIPTVFIKCYAITGAVQKPICHIFQIKNKKWVMVNLPELEIYKELFQKVKPAVWTAVAEYDGFLTPQPNEVKDFVTASVGDYYVPDMYKMYRLLKDWEAKKVTQKLIYIIDNN